MINKYGSESNQRDYALYNAFERLQQDILDNKDLCNRAFRIYETKIYDGEMKVNRFIVDEIPIEIQYLKIPNKQEISFLPRKYNFKERIRILLKGE